MLCNLREPGQEVAGAPTATPTVILQGPKWMMDFVQSRAFAKPVNDHVLIYTPESKEATVFKFVTHGIYAIARHYCDLNLHPCKVPDVFPPYKMTL